MTNPTLTPKYFNLTYPQEYVAHVEINRADKMNSFFEAMWLELQTIFNHLSHSPTVRAIILSGAGPKAFTAGLDVKAASQGLLSSDDSQTDPARKAFHLRRHISSFQDCISAIERCEKPVIVAMHGFSLGLAVDIATAADIRLCAADTKFAVKEVDIGLAADIGTLTRLPKVVGNFGWVKEVALSARIFGAEEALRVGFVSRVFGAKEEVLKGALEVAGLIASKSPVAVHGTKDILNWSRDRSVEDGLRYTSVWNSAALQTKDVSAALLSGIQKRKPTFEKL
ncbi:ClpP/crotonase-like domain-containing protein [Aspergillus caelatus]|uniref:ClpP/crotonase-like domain-containing protein n=2 Tax=Aspergillus subgen. Circumdati TaxID=2720871 RepID=A0A5N7AAX8_9EURO|nr:ClpP/crotonase-like domain-containing protein [Aspergillus caelatus]KAE8366875.1 ClpP/crotonase-like domain-containing protein [Aspergillus caelatus]KAE8419999.1 ClpP/crotonase-like domain-containing protein [Aspergillus pseudocaelatus]